MAALAVLLCVLGAAAAPAHAADEDKLERFLARLGLADLQIVHLENSLESQALSEPERQRLAQRLADLYAERLMESGSDPQRYQSLLARIESLLNRFPQANTAALQIMLLQADYNRAETQIAEWIADRSKQSALSDARTILERIAPQLDDQQQHLNSQVEALNAELDRLPDTDPDFTAKENEARRLQAVLARASYFAGWANYYFGLTREAGGATPFKRSTEIFRKLLTIEDAKYDQLSGQELSLEVPWRARAVIGLGLAEAALGNVDGSRAVFQLLENSAALAEIKDQAAYWFVQGLINAGRLDEARQYAEQKIEEFTGAATQGKVSLCVALVRAGYGASGGENPVNAQLGMLGISGLAKLRQYDAVQQLLEKYNLPLDGQSGFFLQWMQGRRLFAKAQQTKAAEDYRAAAAAFERALDQPDAASQTAAVGHCRYELGWCYYRAGGFAAAARQFEQAITPLKAAGGQEGANAAWMAFVAYKQLTESQPRFASSAIDVLQTLQRDFPGHEHAKNAAYYIAKLQRGLGSPEAAIRDLQKIPPGDPNYLTARFDLCVLLHQQWSEAENASARADLVRQLHQAAEEFIRASGARGDKERQLRALLLVAAAAMETEPRNDQLVDQVLAGAAALADAAPDASSVKAELHYRQMLRARQTDNASQRLAHAQWLADHAPGSPYAVAALIEVSRELQQRLEAASETDRPKLHEEAYSVYTRLVGKLGDSPDVLRSNKNARIALARLANYAYATERYDEAARRLARLLEVDPKNRDYLHQAGLASFAAGRYEEALQRWRTLTLGLPRGSEEWFEAKYYQIASLAETDPPEAQKTLQQLQLLYPNYGSSGWREKFTSLAQRLK